LRLCIWDPAASSLQLFSRWDELVLPTLHLSRSLSSEDVVKTLKSILRGYREELKIEKLTLTSQEEVESSSRLLSVLRGMNSHGQGMV